MAFFRINWRVRKSGFQAWNSGWQYRNDGVDVETNDDSINSNGHHIGFVHKGEWIKYTINVLESGAYKAIARYAAESDGGQFHLSLNGEDITTTQTVSGGSLIAAARVRGFQGDNSC